MPETLSNHERPFELGLYNFVDNGTDPITGKQVDPAVVMQNLLEAIELADQVDLIGPDVMRNAESDAHITVLKAFFFQHCDPLCDGLGAFEKQARGSRESLLFTASRSLADGTRPSCVRYGAETGRSPSSTSTVCSRPSRKMLSCAV